MTTNDAVHASHCCKWHGCKYGDKNCPVVKGKIIQEYLCEHCHEELRDAEYYTQVVARLPEMYRLQFDIHRQQLKESYDKKLTELMGVTDESV